MTTLEKITALHNSEINGSVEWFFDGSWTWKLGDGMNGFVAEDTEPTLDAAVDAMALKACELFPNSDFARAMARAMED